MIIIINNKRIKTIVIKSKIKMLKMTIINNNIILIIIKKNKISKLTIISNNKINK